MVIKFIYTLFLAILLALFVGLGISAFYKAPEQPRYPMELEFVKSEQDETAEQESARKKYLEDQREFEEKIKPYSRNVSIISIVAGVAMLIVSLTLLSKIKMLADGVLLGGVFTTIYSIIRGLISEDVQFRFLIVTAGLVIALVLGWIKFIRPKEAKNEAGFLD